MLYCLLPEVREIWEEVVRLTGKSFRLNPDPAIELYATAEVRVASADEPCHVVRYAPSHEESLPHLLAHEAGHIIRLYSGAEDQRLFAYISPEKHLDAAKELRPYIDRLASKGAPGELMRIIVDQWIAGPVRQATNFPADMRIERWLFESYPGLRSHQRAALKREAAENAYVLRPEVGAAMPKKVHNAMATMNAAMGAYLSWLFDDKRFRQPYLHTPYYERGERLAKRVWSTEDRGQVQDIEETMRWAKDFSISDWFELVRREDVG